MKKLIYALVITLVASSCVLSCKSDDKVEYSSDCYITSFALGGMKRAMHTTTSSGEDTTYYVTLTGSAFPMSINHVDGRITNATALPIGTQVSAVTVTIASQGLVVYASEADTTTWAQHSAKDSLDFSQPLIFRVIATDGKSYRDYRVSLSVRDNAADEYTWTQLDAAEIVAERQAMKMLEDINAKAAQGLVLLSSDELGNCYAGRLTGTQELTSWREQPCQGLPLTADIRSAATFDNTFWMSDNDGRLYTSDDAVTWNEVNQAEHLPLTLVASSQSALYATTATDKGYAIIKSSDGIHWQEMQTEKEVEGKVVASASYEQPNGNRRVIIATSAPDGASIDVWSLLEGHDVTWTLFSDDELNKYRLPASQTLNITAYNNRLLAFSDAAILVSDDNGITWQEDAKLSLPSDATNVQASFAAGEYVYVAGGTQLWQVRLNGYGE